MTCETRAGRVPTTTSLASMPTAESDQTFQLAVIPGDGIGVEVTAEAVKVLDAVCPGRFEPTRYDLGAERYLATGEVLPDSVLAHRLL